MRYVVARKKLTQEQETQALSAIEAGESRRSVAARLGVSHQTIANLAKTSQDAPAEAPLDADGWGQFSETDVGIILAVANAGVPGGLTELARYMECELTELVEVCAGCAGLEGDDA